MSREYREIAGENYFVLGNKNDVEICARRLGMNSFGIKAISGSGAIVKEDYVTSKNSSEKFMKELKEKEGILYKGEIL